jgi:hypothetical protein
MVDKPTPSFELLRVSIDAGALSFEVGWAVIGIFLIVSLLIWGFHATKTGRFSGKAYELSQISVGSGSNKVVLKPSHGDRELAYKIWVELSTRKIGLKIEPEDDVIDEIYDSWYSFFQVTREMIKIVPVSQVRNSESQKIINLSIDVLNDGLRPHLTKWQARFRRWYKNRIDREESFDFHPQDLQKKFPNYEDLVRDMLELNAKLEKYRAELRKIVFE